MSIEKLNNMKFKVVLGSPDGEKLELHPIAEFSHNPDDYGNGYYLRLKDAGLGFNDLFDCRYDKRLNSENLAGYVKELMRDIWTGKNGAWHIRYVKLDQRRWVCSYTNSKGKQMDKTFDDMEEGLAFVRTLDERIEKGTCGGYMFSEL